MSQTYRTTLRGHWHRGLREHQLDDMGGGILAEVRGQPDVLTLRVTRPGLHPLYYGQVGDYLHWDESEWRLHRKMRGLGVKKPKVVEICGGDIITFDGKVIETATQPIVVPPTVEVAGMDAARDGMLHRVLMATEEIYNQHGRGPVVVLLSGGVDSILILWALKAINADVQAVTVGTSEDEFDPWWAKRAAQEMEVPWHFLRLPDSGSPELQALLTQTLSVIEQTSYSNVLMGCCCVLANRWMRANNRPVAYLGFWGDLLFGHKLQVTGSFNNLPAAEKTDARWTRERITHCWHSKPHSLQLAKNFRDGGSTTWRAPFTHATVANFAFGLPLSVAPSAMDKPLLYGLMERFLYTDVCAWKVKKKIGFYTGAGIGKVRLKDPILQDPNIQATYKRLKTALT
jgi:asparagine synthetase B (glutamine-hydrolysing)